MAFQFRAMNFQRGEIIFARANVRAHFAQRADDALHGALLERSVAGQARGESLPGQNSGEETHGGAGISGIQGAPAAFQPAGAAAGYPDRILFDFYVGAQGAHALERAVAIRSGGKMTQFAGAFGEARQHGVAVRNRFIPGKFYAAGDGFCRVYGFFFHAQILP